jgi:hypothetical protein
VSLRRLEQLPGEQGSSYWLTRFVMLRLLGALYAIAFLIAANQILLLIGSNGLLPVGDFLEAVSESLGGQGAGFRRLPSIFWLNHSDAALLTCAWLAVALSCIVAAGYANAIILALLWALYMSFVHVGQDWYGYGWRCSCSRLGFCPFSSARCSTRGRSRDAVRRRSSCGSSAR